MLLVTPCSVIRQVTVDVLDILDKAASTSSAQTRLVFSEFSDMFMRNIV